MYFTTSLGMPKLDVLYYKPWYCPKIVCRTKEYLFECLKYNNIHIMINDNNVYFNNFWC